MKVDTQIFTFSWYSCFLLYSTFYHRFASFVNSSSFRMATSAHHYDWWNLISVMHGLKLHCGEFILPTAMIECLQCWSCLKVRCSCRLFSSHFCLLDSCISIVWRPVHYQTIRRCRSAAPYGEACTAHSGPSCCFPEAFMAGSNISWFQQVKERWETNSVILLYQWYFEILDLSPLLFAEIVSVVCSDPSSPCHSSTTPSSLFCFYSWPQLASPS